MRRGLSWVKCILCDCEFAYDFANVGSAEFEFDDEKLLRICGRALDFSHDFLRIESG
jgi:hypothetical protein